MSSAVYGFFNRKVKLRVKVLEGAQKNITENITLTKF